MRTLAGFALAACAFVALALAPFYLDAYGIGLLIGMTGCVTLASAWGLFSGRTGYVSLATVAFPSLPSPPLPGHMSMSVGFGVPGRHTRRCSHCPGAAFETGASAVLTGFASP